MLMLLDKLFFSKGMNSPLETGFLALALLQTNSLDNLLSISSPHIEERHLLLAATTLRASRSPLELSFENATLNFYIEYSAYYFLPLNFNRLSCTCVIGTLGGDSRTTLTLLQ
jgi:hypothetical protein